MKKLHLNEKNLVCVKTKHTLSKKNKLIHRLENNREILN